MPNHERARRLLDMAGKDYSALNGMMDAGVFSDEVYGFHAQQAVEKAAKAWLESMGIGYARTHNLIALFSSLEDAGAGVSEFWSLAELNPFAVQYRYEALYDAQDGIDRRSVVESVGGFLAHVSCLLGT